MRKIVQNIMILLLLAGCTKQTDWTITPGDNSAIVVDGMITNERKVQTVTLSRPVDQLNGTSLPVTGAVVLISSGDSVWPLAERPANSGIYKSDSSIVGIPQKSYTLQVHSGSQVFSAQTFMVPGQYFQELSYAKNDNDDLYHIDWKTSAFSTANPAMWEVLIDWSVVPGYENADSLSTHARLLFYTLPSLDVSQVFAPEVEKVSFPKGSNITELRYSLNPGHAEFIRELLLETSWTGGFFPTANANVAGNISNGGFGYFGACAVNKLSLIVK
jgi:hypothetical protein